MQFSSGHLAVFYTHFGLRTIQFTIQFKQSTQIEALLPEPEYKINNGTFGVKFLA